MFCIHGNDAQEGRKSHYVVITDGSRQLTQFWVAW